MQHAILACTAARQGKERCDLNMTAAADKARPWHQHSLKPTGTSCNLPLWEAVHVLSCRGKLAPHQTGANQAPHGST